MEPNKLFITWDKGKPDGDRSCITIAKIIEGKIRIIKVINDLAEVKRLAMIYNIAPLMNAEN